MDDKGDSYGFQPTATATAANNTRSHRCANRRTHCRSAQ